MDLMFVWLWGVRGLETLAGMNINHAGKPLIPLLVTGHILR